jgi:hypothetical protein
VVEFFAPSPGTRVLDAGIFVRGSVRPVDSPIKSARIAVNDARPVDLALTSGGTFTQEVQLEPGLNVLRLSARDEKGTLTEPVLKVTRVDTPAELGGGAVLVGKDGPRIQIVFPAEGQETSDESVFLVGKIGAKSEISKIEIFVNGKKLPISRGDSSLDSREVALNQPITLESGTNVIAVTAYDKDGRIGQGVRRIVRGKPRPGGGSAPSVAYQRRYEHRLAATIGINNYASWPSLEGAVHDARQVADKLRKMGFDEVIEIYDRDASRERILRLLSTELKQKTGPDDLAIIFFAGHGATETLPTDEKRGYIIPADANRADPFVTAISMEQLRDISHRLPAKHVYYVMDSCYSGLGLARGDEIPADTSGYLAKMMSKRAVQMITAGLEGEQAFERNGRGLFTMHLLEALDGKADTDHDGAATASEIGNYVRPRVTADSKETQTPQFGTLEGSGEVVLQIQRPGKGK